jgi:hypothetical protein
MSVKKTTIPDDIKADALREYCLKKWGFSYLADAALIEFKEYHETQDLEGKSKKYANWNRALQNFLRWAEPSGRFHSPRQWELWMAAAKAREFGNRGRQEPDYHPQGEQPDTKPIKTCSELALSSIAQMRRNLSNVS